MGSKRIPYIDYLRGLSVVWVVWYHTEHPAFADFPFRIPLFFFVSGIFFKVYDIKTFCRKKFNQLIVPFVFFYLLYYVFQVFLSGLKYHDFSVFDYSWIFDIFRVHRGTESFRVNPPLWFICALLNLQIIYYIICRFIKNKLITLIISAFITFGGLFYLRYIPTPFMLGRSLPYLIYYALGSLYGREIMYSLYDKQKEIKLLFFSIIIICIFTFFAFVIEDKDGILYEVNYYPLILGFIVLLILFFKNFSHYKIFKPLMFFGINSYIVLGMHEVFHTSARILIENTIGKIDIKLGIIQTICTLTILYPTIIILNKYCPRLVSKSTSAKNK